MISSSSVSGDGLVNNLPSDSILNQAISQYIISSSSSSDETNSFHLIHLYVHDVIENLFQLIIKLEQYLTSAHEKERNRATLLLSSLLELQTRPLLNSSQIHHFCIFFGSRLNDYPSIIPSLQALKALVTHQGKNFDPKYRDFNDLFQTLFKELEVSFHHLILSSLLSFPTISQVHTLPQSMRQRVYDLIETLLAHFLTLDSLSESTGFVTSATTQSSSSFSRLRNQLSGEEVVQGVVQAINGEKDPRCLLQCFRIVNHLSVVFAPILSQSAIQTHDPSSPYKSSLPESIFETISCYYPITFHPPPNDPYQITHELLVSTLMEAMISHEAYLPSLIHLIVDHIIHPVEDESLAHSLLYLRHAILKHGLTPTISTILPSIWSPIYNLLTASPQANTLPPLSPTPTPFPLSQGPIPNKEPSMEEMALTEAVALVTVVCAKSIPTQTSTDIERNNWNQFGQPLIDKCRNAINWMNAKHECLHNPTAPSIHSSLHTLDNSAIQSTIRSVFVSRLIGSSSPLCADAIYTSLFPPLLNHITLLFTHLHSQPNQISPRFETYLCHLLHIFDSLLTCNTSLLRSDGSLSAYQPLIGAFYQQLLSYLSHECLYHSSSRSSSPSDSTRLKSQVDLYSHILINCKDLMFRSSSSLATLPSFHPPCPPLPSQDSLC
jgi:hypothetical protein